jgi:ABC-type thiamin/hydroxymethylpyrimidine transport system permease subunit
LERGYLNQGESPAKRSIGAAFGVAFIPAFYLSTALLAAIGPLGVFVLNGLDVTSEVMTLYIMRSVEPPSSAGCSSNSSGSRLVRSAGSYSSRRWSKEVPCEIPFVLTRSRRFDTVMLLISGPITAALPLTIAWVPYGTPNLSPTIQAPIVVAALASGAVLGR